MNPSYNTIVMKLTISYPIILQKLPGIQKFLIMRYKKLFRQFFIMRIPLTHQMHMLMGVFLNLMIKSTLSTRILILGSSYSVITKPMI